MKRDFLLVDGYNIIHAWPELLEMTEVSLESARQKLMDTMSNYQGYHSHLEVIVVFDGYLVKGNSGTAFRYHNIHVVFTKEAETADHYIERLCDQWAERAELGLVEIRVATSDLLEQTLVLGRYATRLSSRELLREIHAAGPEQRRQEFRSDRTLLIDRVPEDVRLRLESLRRGEQYQSEDGNP